MRILIAEDEPLAAQKLQLFLQKLGYEAADITLYSDGRQLMQALQQSWQGNNTDNGWPDLLFMDIQMPGMTGIDVLSELSVMTARPGGALTAPKVIITSAYDRYAIDGFNYGVTDYLLKPYTLDRLRQAMGKVFPQQPIINVRCEGRTERVNTADIVSLLALKDYTRLTLADGRQLTTLGTLSGFEQQLPAQSFVRVQRSHIVGIAHVRSYNTQQVTLSTGETVPIGKTYREAFDRCMQQQN